MMLGFPISSYFIRGRIKESKNWILILFWNYSKDFLIDRVCIADLTSNFNNFLVELNKFNKWIYKIMIWLNLKIFYDKKITNFTYYMLNKGISKCWPEKLNNKINSSIKLFYL